MHLQVRRRRKLSENSYEYQYRTKKGIWTWGRWYPVTTYEMGASTITYSTRYEPYIVNALTLKEVGDLLAAHYDWEINQWELI